MSSIDTTSIPLTVFASCDARGSTASKRAMIIMEEVECYPPDNSSSSVGYAFWVLDRMAPQTNIKKAFTVDSTSVPDTIVPLMTPEHILVVASQNIDSSKVPQGDLYTFLKRYGAGSRLSRMVQIFNQTSGGCGVLSPTSYQLVSVPGTEPRTAGIEAGGEFILPCMTQSSNPGWVIPIGFPDILAIQLMRDGLKHYDPVPIR